MSVSGTITATLSDTLKVSLNEAVTVAALVIVAKMCVKRLTSCSTVGVNFRTGDQGYFDPEGFLVLTGRIKELINRGGEKISPIELDGIMLSHPKIDEAVAFGVPDDMYGQVVQAAIVLKKGEKMTYEELVNFLKKHLASFKIPTKVYFVDKLPKTATGKIQRRVIAETFAKSSRNKSKL